MDRDWLIRKHNDLRGWLWGLVPGLALIALLRPRPRHLGRVLLLRDGVAISRLLPVLALPRLLARLARVKNRSARVKNRSGTNFRRDTRRRSPPRNWARH